MVTKQVMSEFSIANVITEKLIRLEMKAKTKKEAILELSELLKENGIIKDVDDFSSDVFQREKEGITGIGNGVAIPHGKSASVIQTSLVVGKVETPIPWESLDGKGVKGIILFAVGDDNEGAQEHLKLLSLFARKLGNDEVIEQLIQAKDADEVVAAFS